MRGATGTSFRLPDAESLFANDPINNGEIGNPNLEARNGDLRLRLDRRRGLRNLGWELIGFHRQTKNLIDLSGPRRRIRMSSPSSTCRAR